MSGRMVWVGCGRPAAVRIEVYGPAAGRLYGSLDAAAYACGRHAEPAVAAVEAAGLTPYPATAPLLPQGRTCGRIYRFPTATGGTR